MTPVEVLRAVATNPKANPVDRVLAQALLAFRRDGPPAPPSPAEAARKAAR
jgi:hypothetical protein